MDVRKAYSKALIISIAITGSIFIYMAVVEIIKYRMRPFSGLVDVSNLLFVRYIFYGLSIFLVLVTRVLRGVLLKRSFKDDKDRLIQKIYRTSLISMVLCEGPALFGLVLFLLTGLSLDFYLLSFVTLFLIFMYFPRYQNWVKQLT